MSWWESDPERLERELEALEQAGIEYTVGLAAKNAGVLILRLRMGLDGVELDLEAHFPDFYPTFRVEVSAPGMNLHRHQHRLGKNLCLLARGTENWDPKSLLAELLAKRLPMVLQAVDEGAGTPLEDPQAEPISDYFLCQPNASIIIDGATDLGNAAFGTFEVAILSAPGQPLRGVVTKVTDASDGSLYRVDPVLEQRRAGAPTVAGRWARCPVPPGAFGDARLLRDELRPILNLKSAPYTGGRDRPNGELLAAVFEEEHTWPARTGTGWIFIHTPGDRPDRRSRTVFIRAARGGPADLQHRSIQRNRLVGKTVVVIGLGSLGLPILLGLGRAGVGHLRYVDFKSVDPGITTRTGYHYSQVGLTKVQAATDLLGGVAPFVDVHGVSMRIGSPGSPDDPRRQQDVLSELLTGADLLVDATAERGVQALTAYLATQRSIPHIVTSATPGGWGGTVGVFAPGSDLGCAVCWLWAREDDATLNPAAMENGQIQPPGCADPTFIGEGADLATIATEATRTATHLLTGSALPGWNVATCNLVDPATGVPTRPTWTEHAVSPHAGCGCGRRNPAAS